MTKKLPASISTSATSDWTDATRMLCARTNRVDINANAKPVTKATDSTVRVSYSVYPYLLPNKLIIIISIYNQLIIHI